MYLGMEAKLILWRKTMLVLTRKIGESIMIDDEIKIQILNVKGRQIRIGIEAPESVLIFREEIYKKILVEKQIDQSGE